MPRKIFLIAVVIVASLTAVFSAVSALTYSGILQITCTNVFNTVDLGTFDRDNTGIGLEAFGINVTDGAGTVILSGTNTQPVGAVLPFGSISYAIAPQYNPITVTAYSLAGNGLPEQIVTVQQGNCPGLPTFAGSATGACLPLTDVAVVGSMPLDTQAFYAPGQGQEAAGVVINAGTYWVLGQDESHKFYKILLACQYLWVPTNSMQPSFQSPWQGQALPTEVTD